jgi:two-component system chemotaxis response regulator CheB
MPKPIIPTDASTHAPAKAQDAARSSNRTASRFDAILIGGSTGGPQALSLVLNGLVPYIKAIPVFVVLHVPGEFAPVLSRHAALQTGLPIGIAEDNEPAEPGRIYFSPGDLHLRLDRHGHKVHCRHSDAPPEHFVKPAVNVLFHSAAEAYGGRVLGIVLSGMGTDGIEGAGAIVAAGGLMLVQDKATSVVWGMPGAIAAAGLAHAVLPVEKIAAAAGALLQSARQGAVA